jgi:hypothetical protein
MTSASLIPASASVIAQNNAAHDAVVQVTQNADQARERQTVNAVASPLPGDRAKQYGLFSAVSGAYDTRV